MMAMGASLGRGVQRASDYATSRFSPFLLGGNLGSE
jgi:hypothetical protein